MDGLSSAAGVFAVVSLALQLVQTVQDATKFLKNVQDAPKEVLRLIETLEQLHGTLDHVRQLLEEQFLVRRLPGSPTFITKALENCERQIKTLEEFASKAKTSFNDRHRLQRTWASMKIVAKKQDIEDIQCRLRDAKMDLQFAISSNSWQLQMYHMQDSDTVIRQISEICSVKRVPPISHQDAIQRGNETTLRATNPSKPSSRITKQVTALKYGGIFGNIIVLKKSRVSEGLRPRATEEVPVTEEEVWTIRPSFLSYVFEMRYMKSFGHISRTLSTYPILNSHDIGPLFEMCYEGDIEGLQVVLSSGGISPFVSDSTGFNLLHYASSCYQPELCDWLLQVGIDPERRNKNGQYVSVVGLQVVGAITLEFSKPLQMLGYPFRYSHSIEIRRGDTIVAEKFRKSVSDSIRAITKSQDVSDIDVSHLLSYYDGPPEGLEVLLSQDLLPFEASDRIGDKLLFPPLATALRNCGNTHELEGFRHWEPLIRKLIRGGADLHALVPSEFGSYIGTPLDELFALTSTPADSKAAADKWIQILAGEGHDVVAYLERERDIHFAVSQLALSSSAIFIGYSDVFRELIFELGGLEPHVYWVWSIDPESATHLLHHEFRQIIMLSTFRLVEPLGQYTWEESWPFHYPVWHDECKPWDSYEEDLREWQRLHDAAQRRSDRRLQKGYEKGTGSRRLRYFRMPGAWCT